MPARVLFLAILVASEAHAHRNDYPCLVVSRAADAGAIDRLVAQAPKPVAPKVLEIRTHEITDKVGTVTALGEPLGAIENGRHLYLVVRTPEGKIFIARSPRLADRTADPDGKFLATHRALMKNFPDGTEVLAAGELLMLRGKLRELSNGAGTFPAGEAHLNFARDVFRESAVPMEANTKFLDYDKNQKALEHAEAERIARIQLFFEETTNTELYLIRRKGQLLLNLLHEKFPGGEAPGSTNRTALIRALDRKHVDQLDTFVRLAEYEGIEFALHTVFARRKTEQMLDRGEEAYDLREKMRQDLDEALAYVRGL